MSKYKFIACGGTGARIAISLIILAAMGICDLPDLEIIQMDLDMRGDQGRLSELWQHYRTMRARHQGWKGPDRLFFPDITLTPWNLTAAKEETLAASMNPTGRTFLDLATTEGERKFMRLLYDEETLNFDLDKGFFGRPAMGASMLRRMSEMPCFHSAPIWASLREHFAESTVESPAIFVAGSIFGGTGAAFFYNVAKLLRQEVNSVIGLNRHIDRRHMDIGGALMLPYFRTPPDEGHHSLSDEFGPKAKVALAYYDEQPDFVRRANEEVTEHSSYVYNKVYLLSSPQHDLVSTKQCDGGEDQADNRSHYLELVAALSALDFFRDPRQAADPALTHGCFSLYQGSGLEGAFTFADLPAEVSRRLQTFTRYIAAVNTSVIPQLTLPQEALLRSNIIRKPLHLSAFRRLTAVPPEAATLANQCSGFCTAFLRYAGDLSASSAMFDRDLLFNAMDRANDTGVAYQDTFAKGEVPFDLDFTRLLGPDCSFAGAQTLSDYQQDWSFVDAKDLYRPICAGDNNSHTWGEYLSRVLKAFYNTAGKGGITA